MRINLKWRIAEWDGIRLPEWKRCVAMDDKGEIYFPSSITRNGQATFLMACYDGASVVMDGKHAYYPLKWLRTVFQEDSDYFDRVENRVRGWFEEEKQ